jgi:hypothetical protein
MITTGSVSVGRGRPATPVNSGDFPPAEMQQNRGQSRSGTVSSGPRTLNLTVKALGD